MSSQTALHMMSHALYIALWLSVPLLGVALGVGLLVSFFQAVTQINEQTLSFLPKILAIAAGLAVFGGWMLNTLMQYTIHLWQSMGKLP